MLSTPNQVHPKKHRSDGLGCHQKVEGAVGGAEVEIRPQSLNPPWWENDHDDEGHGGFGVYLVGWLSWLLFFGG